MTYAPVVPVSGYGGWTFLKRTMAAQKAAFAASPEIRREAAYYRANIGKADTADALVKDRRLLDVSLDAYGLGADIGNKAFVRKVLSDGTLEVGDLANRLADKQYYALSSGFGYGDYAVPRTKLSDFADKTLAAWTDRKFEAAVGEQNGDLRLALNAEREIGKLATREAGDRTLWYTVLGSAPLRQVFQGALGLPSSFASIDLDKQVSTLQEKTARDFGAKGIREFADPAKMEMLIRRFLVRAEAQASGSGSSPGALALQLLRRSA